MNIEQWLINLPTDEGRAFKQMRRRKRLRFIRRIIQKLKLKYLLWKSKNTNY
jgi:hypothetical protein